MNRARGTETVESSHAIVDVAHTLTGNGFDASEDGTGRGTPIVPQWWSGADVADSLTGTSDDQRMPDKQRFQAVIDAPSFGMIGASGQEGAIVEQQPAITASHGQPGNVAIPAGMMFEPNDGVSYDGMNQKLEFGVHRALRIGRDSSDFVVQPDVEPQAFRKAARAQSSVDAESWVEDGQANTLNAFDVGDTRTTHAIVEPTAFTQNQREEVRVLGDQTAALAANTGMHQTNYIHSYGVRRLTPVECERLQSFPDGWTEPAVSDSARYKAMGNAVTVNVVRWILGRLP